jgi:uncharacterized protein with HEPN domain
MSDTPQRLWRFYVDDMIQFAEKVLAYTNGLDQAGFVANELHYDATLRNLELIGEAATHIPDSVRVAYPHIPWRLIIATRNRLIHGYLGIDNDTLWSIVQDNIPVVSMANSRSGRPDSARLCLMPDQRILLRPKILDPAAKLPGECRPEG